MSAKKLSPELDYPDLSKHSNHMAKHLTKEMYAKLRDVTTSSGYTFDECIQTGEFLFSELEIIKQFIFSNRS